MDFSLPKELKDAIPLPHFPTKHQAFIFRACEYISSERIAKILNTNTENIRKCIKDLGLNECENEQIWLSKGYITIIRRLWHILPYSQLLQVLDMDEGTLAMIMREEDFLDIKLKEKPICKPVYWRELTEDEKVRTAEIKKIMSGLSFSGKKPFEFEYSVPKIEFSGKEKFKTRMAYAFSGVYQNAFEMDSETYCTDEMLEAYSKLGINALWTQGVLYQLTEFPFDKSLSEGYKKRLERMRKFTERLEKYGIKLMLYLNEPRCMTEEFFEKYPNLRGQKVEDGKICMCTSTKEVQEYLKNAVESLCRAVPKLGGFFTITRSENPTNCYSHKTSDTCTCPRCKDREDSEVIAEVIGCISEGAHRVSADIKVIAWSWAWSDINLDIIRKLPKDVIFQSQSELKMPFEIGGVKGKVYDYSISIVGPGERAKREWAVARECGLECSAKVQINTSWECSTVPAMPIYPNIEKHMQGLVDEGVEHIMLSWTLGGYPSHTIAHAAKYFFESCNIESESETVQRATEIFCKAFAEFPFHISTLYYGPQNAGPSVLLFDKPTGYSSTMTCFSYDDYDKWRSIYPLDVFESQLGKLSSEWEKGLEILKNEPLSEAVIMARAAYCLFKSSHNQVCFYIARDSGDRESMKRIATNERDIAKEMLTLMNENSAIGFEAANHYYFSKGQLAEKIINCEYIIG